MESREPSQGNTYRIRVKGTLGQYATDWFGDLTITLLQNGETMLVGRFTDQSTLRGLLDQLWDLNFTYCLSKGSKDRGETRWSLYSDLN
jgi:hypothetical protein